MIFILVMSSRPEPLLEEPGWLRNGAGRQFSHKFGYGLMDAERIVDLATNWRTLPSQHICQTGINISHENFSGINSKISKLFRIQKKNLNTDYSMMSSLQ